MLARREREDERNISRKTWTRRSREKKLSFPWREEGWEREAACLATDLVLPSLCRSSFALSPSTRPALFGFLSFSLASLLAREKLPKEGHRQRSSKKLPYTTDTSSLFETIPGPKKKKKLARQKEWNRRKKQREGGERKRERGTKERRERRSERRVCSITYLGRMERRRKERNVPEIR